MNERRLHFVQKNLNRKFRHKQWCGQFSMDKFKYFSFVSGFAVGGLSGGEAKSEFWKIVKVRQDFWDIVVDPVKLYGSPLRFT
jgi:hypothetical protein